MRGELEDALDRMARRAALQRRRAEQASGEVGPTDHLAHLDPHGQAGAYGDMTDHGDPNSHLGYAEPPGDQLGYDPTADQLGYSGPANGEDPVITVAEAVQAAVARYPGLDVICWVYDGVTVRPFRVTWAGNEVAVLPVTPPPAETTPSAPTSPARPTGPTPQAEPSGAPAQPVRNTGTPHQSPAAHGPVRPGGGTPSAQGSAPVSPGQPPRHSQQMGPPQAARHGQSPAPDRPVPPPDPTQPVRHAPTSAPGPRGAGPGPSRPVSGAPLPPHGVRPAENGPPHGVRPADGGPPHGVRPADGGPADGRTWENPPAWPMSVRTVPGWTPPGELDDDPAGRLAELIRRDPSLLDELGRPE